jgi:hypothetical protein
MIAFVIDASIRGYLIKESKKCDEIIKPLLRGRDMDGWSVQRRQSVSVHHFP